jgi:general secretion pathway protein C
MNSHSDSKFFFLLWWGVLPFLSAMLIDSAIVFFVDNKYDFTIKPNSSKIFFIKNVPVFVNTDVSGRKKENINLKPVQKWDDIELKACYIDNHKRFVVIRDKAKTLFLYPKDIYKRAKLTKVGADYAIFVKNGKKIKLTLSKENKKLYSKGKKLPQGSNTVQIKRDTLVKYENNLLEVLRDIGFKIVNKNGDFGGIKMEFIKKGSLFDKMGLKKYDVIKSIDGKNLNSIMDLLPYYNQIDNITTLQIGFERNNEMKEITYEIN